MLRETRTLAWLAAVIALPALAADPATTTAGTGGPADAGATTVPAGERSPAYAPDAGRRAELRHMLVQDCGSCHGATLKGGLGPALTADALAGKDPYVLARVILDGRHGTPMAPWKLFLNEREAEWLARQLLAGTAHAP